jgi:hypothetical protein
MSDTASKDSTNVALQVCFGAVAIVAILVGLAGWNYRDSLGIVVYRRYRESGDQKRYEAAISCNTELGLMSVRC